jgi:hypothetical protein
MPLCSSLGQHVVASGDAQQRVARTLIMHLIGLLARFRYVLPPVLRVITIL